MPTVYLWTGPYGPACDETWVKLTDADDANAKSSADANPKMQSGIMLIEDMMTGGLILSKKLEHVFDTLVWDTEVVLVLGDGISESDMNAIDILVIAQKVAAVITCDEGFWQYEEDIPVTCVSSILDPFGVDLMWRELKRRKHERHTYVFMGTWHYDERHPVKNTSEKFAKREKEAPASACLFDPEAWCSLHPGTKADPTMRVIMNARVVFENYVSHDKMKLVIKEGDGGGDGGDGGDDGDRHGGCDCDCEY